MEETLNKAPITFSPNPWRFALLYFFNFAPGWLLGWFLFDHGVSIGLIVGGATGVLIGVLIQVRFMPRRPLEVSEDYLEGPTRWGWRGTSFRLSDLDRADSGRRGFGNVRLCSYQGERIVIDYLGFSRDQRRRILQVLGILDDP